ncbi:hypothetical protein [Salinicola peritrichatus]|uniref:hypothetical protein n=1 Tax=Salinicola peritrichatus TaxID=1267424 RepID=UPI000DA1896F|nr:hypothetical protein [Salinicola peritrichatus]
MSDPKPSEEQLHELTWHMATSFLCSTPELSPDPNLPRPEYLAARQAINQSLLEQTRPQIEKTVYFEAANAAHPDLFVATAEINDRSKYVAIAAE